MVQSWDCSFKDSATADFVAGHIWGFADGKFYLIDRVHRRMGLPETVAAVRVLAKDYPLARGILVEDKANGPAVEQMLRNEMPGIIMMEPKEMGGSKVGRANAVAPLFEAGSVLVPPRSQAPWIEAWREEMATFPFAKNDDDVDATTQAIIYLHGHRGVTFGKDAFKPSARTFGSDPAQPEDLPVDGEPKKPGATFSLWDGVADD
jgi:predicted phage terminase large subunit-like protein